MSTQPPAIKVSLCNDTITVELPDGNLTHLSTFQVERIVQILRNLSAPPVGDWRADFQRKLADPEWEKRVREAGARRRDVEEKKAERRTAKATKTRDLARAQRGLI